ncbi:hypothetical protein [Enhygromyxa salina]|uniref:Uncharacterized protein n=1 Tax=Enhygromyxa salina TaxID=215803 RepID=A0A2S9YWC4_9BACT|nr:hypothetical protein [Enhygromyxa salina]PRQ09383.1 hypothetical protein ENSA7_09100 [Enhygromyxa salina]
MPTPRLSRYLLVLLLGSGLGVAVSCFAPPSDDVLFSCEFDGDDKCPPDYACEADDCCHRVGSEVKVNEGNWGSCALGGNSGGTTTGPGTTDETGSDTQTGTDTSTDTGSETDTGTDTGTDGP